MQPDKTQKLTITDFSGRLTRFVNGDINSGFAKYSQTHSVNNFGQPQNLQWMEQATQIDANASVITDLIVAGKARLESGTTYVYAVGHTGRIYKIQVNNPGSTIAQYDNPVLLTTLTNSQTFQYGASLLFGGTTEKMFIGCDQGLTSLNFDGTSETVIGTSDSTHWIANVPRQGVIFGSNIYYTNGSNIAEFSLSSLTVTSYQKLSPGFPSNTQSRDIRLSADGRYAVIVVSRNPLNSILATTQDTNEIANIESYLYYWNGSDLAATSSMTTPSFAMTAYMTFGQFEYSFGYDITGSSMFTNGGGSMNKTLSLILNECPLPNSIGANGNILGWQTTGYDFATSKQVMYIYLYGSLDSEVDVGFYRQYKQAATSPSTDILQVPWGLLVTNFTFGASTFNYGGHVAGIGRMYFSTYEYDGTTPKYRLWSFTNVPIGNGTSCQGVYETQTQLFSKKIKPTEVRVYTEPMVSNNSFKIDLIGSDGNVISGSTHTFTVGNADCTVGQDMMMYDPQTAGTYALGLRITNLGTKNWIGHKVEIDYTDYGK